VRSPFPILQELEVIPALVQSGPERERRRSTGNLMSAAAVLNATYR
jgi:hypothetical protein